MGGGGGNAIKTMHKAGLDGVQFIVANTDLQALEEHEDLDCTIQLGAELTKGLGAGANPEIGRQAAIESCNEIVESLKGADMVFITAGMGGGTGTGAAGVIARIAKEQGALTVGVVTRPFFFEGQRRARHAETGIQFLKENVDTLIVIPNQKLLKTVNEDTSLLSAFKSVDNILLKAIQGIVDLINERGLINLDFADVKTIMAERGLAIIGTGSAKGTDRAISAGQMAISSPLLEDTSFKGALGLIINITGGPDLSLKEVNQTAELITAEAHPDAEIIFGAIVDSNESSDEIKVTVIATGFEGAVKKEREDKIQVKKTKSEKQYNLIAKKMSFSDSEKTASSDIATKQSESSNQLNVESSQSLNQNDHIKTITPLSPSTTEYSQNDKPIPSKKLPKDILMEKAMAYQETQVDETRKSATNQQLSMNIGSNKDKIRTQKYTSPFEKAKPRLIGLFKKSDKTH